MFDLVDVQVIKSKSEYTNYSFICGILDTDTDELYYYKFDQENVYKMLKKFGQVHGIVEADGYFSLIVKPHNDITFIDNATGKIIYHTLEYRLRNGYVYTPTCNIMTVFLRRFKIKHLVYGVNFWYKGVYICYKRGIMARQTGFNLVRTINWRESVSGYFGFDHFYPLYDNADTQNEFYDLSVFKRQYNWPDSMNNEYFILALNELAEYYDLNSFYECMLPYCSYLNLRGLNLSNLTNIMSSFKNNNNLRIVKLDDLDLSILLNADSLFWGCNNIEFLDFSRCKGDILDTLQFKQVFKPVKKKMIIVARENQTNLVTKLKDLAEYVTTVDKFDETDIESLNAKVILLRKALFVESVDI